MQTKTLRAVEFFSGIGAFSEACRDSAIEVIAAFDQNSKANEVFHHNFSLRPQAKNLDTLQASDIPGVADIWWMSPPCTPFSRRGKQLDEQDPRAACFLKLIELLPEHLPRFLMMENVKGFLGSRVHERLKFALAANGYTASEVLLCSTELGVPMRRPRFFIAASRVGQLKPFVKRTSDTKQTLRHFLTSDEDSLLVPEEIVEKYMRVLNIVDPADDNARVICFTRGYNRCRKASGSLIKTQREGRVRFVSPEEILSLLGFSSRFQMPESISRDVAWRLVGNSVDVRAVRALVETLPIAAFD